jgi:hypothetical protein
MALNSISILRRYSRKTRTLRPRKAKMGHQPQQPTRLVDHLKRVRHGKARELHPCLETSPLRAPPTGFNNNSSSRHSKFSYNTSNSLSSKELR